MVYNNNNIDMAQIYDSSHSGQEIDAAVDAVQTTIPSQLAQIGSKIGDLTELETTDKSDLVSAINEVKNNMSTTAEDTTYEDNYGTGADNVQDALDTVAEKVLENFGGATVAFGDAVSSVTGKYVASNGSVGNSGTATNTIAYYEIPSGLKEIDISIPKTGGSATRPVSLGTSSSQTSNLKVVSNAGANAPVSYTLQYDSFAQYSYLVLNYDSVSGEPTINGVTNDYNVRESIEKCTVESNFDGVSSVVGFGNQDCTISGKYIQKSDGQEGSHSSFKCSDFIQMPQREFVVTSNYTLTNGALVAFYAEDETYLGYLSGDVQRTDYSYTAPEDTKYIRLTLSNGKNLSVSFNLTGSKALTNLFLESTQEKSINILWAGNSFTTNTVTNLGTVMGNLGVSNINLNTVITNNTGLDYWDNGFSSISKTTNLVYGQGLNLTNTLENILASAFIDIMVIQQVSTNADSYSSYIPYLASLIKKIRSASKNKGIKIALVMTWGTSSAPYADIINTIKSVMENHNYIDYMIPLGTAVESARISSIAEGNNGFSRDSNIWHLAAGFGEYLASCTFYQYLCERFTHIQITGDTTTISVDGNLGELAVTDENRGLAHTAAINASILKYTPLSLD